MRARGESRTNWAKVDAKTQEEIEAAIASDPEEVGIEWDWDSAQLVMPEPKEHINLRVDADVLRFFRFGYALTYHLRVVRVKNHFTFIP